MTALIPYPIAPNTIYAWDALTTARTMRASGFRVNCVVTSPPYYQKRDYGVEGQIGLEDTPEAYVTTLVEIFATIRDVLADNGVVWINLGDTYAAGGRGAPDPNRQKIRFSSGTANAQALGYRGAPVGYKPKDLLMIPARVAIALQEDGWYLRSDVIWAKVNCMPESVEDRPTSSHEHILLLAKSPDYYYDKDAISEPVLKESSERARRGVSSTHKNMHIPGQSQHSMHKARSNGTGYNMPERRNKRDVWFVETQPSSIPHYAMMPERIAETCILAGCPEGGIVFDPFMGVGTTAVVARRLKRRFVGAEINPASVAWANERLRLPFEQHYTAQENNLDELPLFAGGVA